MYAVKAVPKFDIYTPSSFAEAIRILTDLRGGAVLYAGGTDLMPMMRRGKIKPSAVVDVSGLNGFDQIRKDGNFFRIGGLATIQQLATNPVIPKNYFSIKWLTNYFGAETTRHMATVGGNLASGGERDVPAILASLDAVVKIVGPFGERHSPPLNLKLDANEFIAEAFFEDWGPNSVSWFSKFEKRASNGIGVVTATVSVKTVDSRFEKVRIVLNRVEGRTMGRLTELENELCGKVFDPYYVKEAVESHISKIKPASDFRASSEFRKHVSKVLVRRGLEFCMKYLEGKINDEN